MRDYTPVSRELLKAVQLSNTSCKFPENSRLSCTFSTFFLL
uniref:Uncharacterized protein n=1 Tax=Anguilla anguilla TaxID=7936 RepID=A0A0E9VK68_ANGAN